MRSIIESTRAFEAWMRKRTDVSERLLKEKHREMAKKAFHELMNPKATTETLPAARDGKTQAGSVNVKP